MLRINLLPPYIYDKQKKIPFIVGSLMLIPITYDLARGARANSVLSIVLTIGAASAFVGIIEYSVMNFDGLGKRPTGTLSHWMTYSGTLMLVICASVTLENLDGITITVHQRLLPSTP